MVCDICGREADQYFLRQVRDDNWKWGIRDVWVCWRCIDIGLQLKEWIESEGCLNSMEVCRLLNGFEKDDFDDCYAERGFAFITRCERCNHKERGCHFWSLTVYNELRKLEEKGVLHSEKTRFWDKRKGQGRRLDLFRFWFINREDYKNRVLKQKIEGYL
jgi:hypothetical protein